MRQVFTSPRIETVEGVAQLLNAENIATLIRNGRSYNSGYGRSTSYAKASSQPAPSLWVVHADDFPRARQLLREAGLIEADEGRESFIPAEYRAQSGKGGNLPARLRMLLMLAIGLIIGMGAIWQYRQSHTSRPASHPSAAVSNNTTQPQTPGLPQLREAEQIYQVDVPSALADTLVAHLEKHHGIAPACKRRDGNAPANNTDCQPGADFIDIHTYLTDGSGQGTVRADWHWQGAIGNAVFDARREGFLWHVAPQSPL